jgi:hypothetical protein
MIQGGVVHDDFNNEDVERGKFRGSPVSIGNLCIAVAPGNELVFFECLYRHWQGAGGVNPLY